MIERLGSAFAAAAERWVPSPFVLALVLTVVTFLLATFVTGASPVQAWVGWGDGFWEFLKFGMQMTLILVTGHALATSAPVERVVDGLARLPRGPRSAAALAGFASVTLSLIHWGLGLVASALLARRIGQTAGRRGISIHYPLVVAAAYSGFMTWHGGLSGSAPLTVATPGHFLEAVIGVIPAARTIGSPRNLALSAALVVAIPLLMAAMAPRSNLRGAPAELVEERPADRTAPPRSRLDAAMLLGLAVALAGLGLVARAFLREGFAALDFDLLNFAFLFLGLLVWKSPDAYGRAITEGIGEASGIVLQFPFYAGILGMMKSTGLVDRLAEAGAAVGHGVFLLSTFVAATVVNMFVPSGGAQWGVQGPAVVQAAHQLGIPPERVVLAVAWGDEWSNMLQPFWALAVLGPTRLEARDIFGYTTLIMLLTGPLYVAALLL